MDLQAKKADYEKRREELMAYYQKLQGEIEKVSKSICVLDGAVAAVEELIEEVSSAGKEEQDGVE